VSDPLIRAATEGDLPAINAIYNHYVLHSTCVWQTETETAEGRRAWFVSHDDAHPVTVAEGGGEVVGWASLTAYNTRCGWRHTVEDSVYIRHDRQGQGVGTRLLADLLDRAGRLGCHAVIAAISADQAPSIRLHARLGFVEVGRLRETGRKFDQWLDAVYLQKLLGGGPGPC
jgi:L-amino acid N-acyltransferase YncA